MRKGIEFNKAGFGRFGEAAYRKVKECGFDAVDFAMADTETCYYTLPLEEAFELMDREKALAADAGVVISQVHGPWRYPPQDYSQEDRAERMEKMKKSIYFTSLLDCKYWIIHPIMPFNHYELGKPEAKDTWDMNLEFMSELLKTAKDYGVTICLENMPMHTFSISTPDHILKFVKEMNDDNFQICLDTGHVSVFGDLSVAEETRKLGSYIKTLHVHDNRYGADAHLFPLFGVIDWADFSKALKDINYQGVFSVETLPSKSLPDEIYGEMCVSLYKIADYIANKM